MEAYIRWFFFHVTLIATLTAIWNGAFFVALLYFSWHIGGYLNKLVSLNNGNRMPIRANPYWIQARGKSETCTALGSDTAYAPLARRYTVFGELASIGDLLQFASLITIGIQASDSLYRQVL